MAAPILLIHGAWHGAWCWDRLIPALAERGRAAVAIDLPGAGATPLSEVSLDRYARRVVEALRRFGEPALLVGHSLGGVSISAAADLAPERITKLIYLCALVPAITPLPETGTESFRSGSLVGSKVSDDGLTVTALEETIRPAFYNDCSDADVAFARARLKPLPTSLWGEASRQLAGRSAELPRVYIECTGDRTVPIEHQRAMIAASQPIEVHTLETGHSPFFSAPDALADILARL